MTTKKEKISQVKKLLSGEQIREMKVFRVVSHKGTETCSDPGYPDEVQPQDIVIHVNIISESEIPEYRRKKGLPPFNE